MRNIHTLVNSAMLPTKIQKGLHYLSLKDWVGALRAGKIKNEERKKSKEERNKELGEFEGEKESRRQFLHIITLIISKSRLIGLES